MKVRASDANARGAPALGVQAALDACRFQEAVALARQAVDAADRAQPNTSRSDARRLLASALIHTDALDEAERVAHEAVRIARAARTLSEEARAELLHAEILRIRGNAIDALRHAARGRKLAHKGGEPRTVRIALARVARLLALAGDDDRARTLADEAVASTSSAPEPFEATIFLACAYVHAAGGRGAVALSLLDRAQSIAGGAPFFGRPCAAIRARVWLDVGAPERARAALDDPSVVRDADGQMPRWQLAQELALRAAISLALSEPGVVVDALLDQALSLGDLPPTARAAVDRVRANALLARGRAEEAERLAVGLAATASRGGFRVDAAHGLAIAAKAGSPDAWLLRWLGALSLASAGTSARIEHEAQAALVSEPDPIGALARSVLAVTRARLVEHAPDEARVQLKRTLRQVESRVQTLRQTRRAGAEVTLDDVVMRTKDDVGIAGSSPALLKAISTVSRAARSDASVVLTGETGSGKELFARFVHRLSSRGAGPFVAVSCAAIPEPLLEAELFGHERGAFTGAERTRAGLFVQAEGGTLFLDEVGEMSHAMQVKLLRVLEDREVRAVGGNKSRKVDVRVVAATHRDLGAMVAGARFREDLYYRLAAITVRVPSLRERPEDVPTIARALLARDPSTRNHRFDVPALTALAEHTWPGNVRELANVLRVAAALSEGNVIGRPDLERAINSGATRVEHTAQRAIEETTLAALRARHRAELRELVGRALASSDGNKLRAARALGVSRQGLYRVLAETS
jgi:DNA-binding NtrC family response regulator/tetratricopeptide (TPR) repeat protein